MEMFTTDSGISSTGNPTSTVGAPTSNTDNQTTYVMIAPPQEGETTLTIQTKEEFSGNLEGSSVQGKEITALVVEEDDLVLPGPSQDTGQVPATIGWSKAAVLKLIQLHKEHQHLFNDPHYKKKSVWEMVSMSLQKEKYPYSWLQAENKWKAITKKYRDTLDYNAKHGHILKRKCPFFHELAAVYDYTSPYEGTVSNEASYKSFMNPSSYQHKTIAMVTTQLPSVLKRPLEQDSFPSTSSSTSPSTSERIKTIIVENQPAHDEDMANKVLIKKKKYIPTTNDNVSDVGQVLHMLRVLNEDRRKQEKLRMERLEKMHQEKMALLKEFLDVLKGTIDKEEELIRRVRSYNRGNNSPDRT